MLKKLLVKIIGIALLSFSLYFIFQNVIRYKAQLYEVFLIDGIFSVIFFQAFLYGLNLFLLSFAWHKLLIVTGQKNIKIGLCHYIYGQTQILKYLPGNIFHLASRQVLGGRLGIAQARLATLALYEALGLVLLSGALGISGYLSYGLKITGISFLGPIVGYGIALLLLIFILILATKLSLFKEMVAPEKKNISVFKSLSFVFLVYLLFLCISGALLALSAFFISGQEIHTHFFAIISIFAMSWVLGFLAPGSSGGIGVREMCLVLLLNNFFPESVSLAVSLAFRMVTLLGDVWFFILSFYFKPKNV